MTLDRVVDTVFKEDLDTIVFKHKLIINTINPHSYCETKKDPVFKAALEQSDMLLPDGSGIVLAAKVLNGEKIQKIAGADVHQFLLNRAHKNHQKVFYLGASQDTLNRIEQRIKQELPNISLKTYSPPYKTVFSDTDTYTMLEKVNKFNPDVLFVGMTAPKQEKWVHLHKAQINAKVTVSIGAVFDFYAGTVKRSSPFWINLGLEWLPRLIQEPRRLWRRNFVSTPVFLFDLFKCKLRQLLSKS